MTIDEMFAIDNVFAASTVVTGELLEHLKKKCQVNPWLKVNGIDFADEMYYEGDYPYTLNSFENKEDLAAFFVNGNMGLRVGVQYKDLIFVNQINGGDEWWGLKMHEGMIYSFESISWSHIIMDEGLDSFYKQLDAMVTCSKDECMDGTWYRISH